MKLFCKYANFGVMDSCVAEMFPAEGFCVRFIDRCPRLEGACVAEPCRHGGTCLDMWSWQQCQCTEGFTGPICEKCELFAICCINIILYISCIEILVHFASITYVLKVWKKDIFFFKYFIALYLLDFSYDTYR